MFSQLSLSLWFPCCPCRLEWLQPLHYKSHSVFRCWCGLFASRVGFWCFCDSKHWFSVHNQCESHASQRRESFFVVALCWPVHAGCKFLSLLFLYLASGDLSSQSITIFPPTISSSLQRHLSAWWHVFQALLSFMFILLAAKTSYLIPTMECSSDSMQFQKDNTP